MGGVLITIAALLPTVLCPIRPTLCGSRSRPPWRLAPSALPTTTSRWSSAATSGLTARCFDVPGARRRGVALALVILQQFRVFSTQINVPFIKSWHPDLLWHGAMSFHSAQFLIYVPFILWVVIVLTGSSNAVNLTDGLDGLAIGCTIIAAGALAVLTYVSGTWSLPTTRS